MSVLLGAKEVSELIVQLQQFKDADAIISCIRDCYLRRKEPNQIFNMAVDKSIYRAFPNEKPSERYNNWRWQGKGNELIERLNSITSQESFDTVISELAVTLNEDWRTDNPIGENTHMQIGLAYKIANLVLKHFSFSMFVDNKNIINYLHVPWDKYTLIPLRHIYTAKLIPQTASQGFVTSIEMYNSLHNFISEIAKHAKVPRIYYELMTWDNTH